MKFRRKKQVTLSRPEASPFGSNDDDRRQRRKQGGVVGAAASRMRGPHQGPKQTLGAATRVPYKIKKLPLAEELGVQAYQDRIIRSLANSPPLAIWNFASRSETCRFFFSSPETS